ncbi:MAG: Panacea domain-containing protein [Bacteroidota bacterium]
MSIKEKKIIQAIIYFASKTSNGQINRLKLMKLLWLADRYHLNKYGRLILPDNYYALPQGPVPSKTMNYSKESIENAFEVNGYSIKAKSEFDPRYFSKSDLDIMEEIWERYSQYDQFELKKLSHNFPEWKRYEKELNDSANLNSYPIVLDDFFKEPENKVNYEHDSEKSESSKTNFHFHTTIQDFLS